MLKLRVNQPGIVTVRGGRIVSATVKAQKAGEVSVPIKLSRRALSELHTKGSLRVRFTVGFDGETQKEISLTVKAASARKGGKS